MQRVDRGGGMMLSRSRITTILGLTAALAALTAGTVLATTTKRFDSKVTLSTTNPFHGRVISEKHACEIDRTVKVFNKKPGPDGLFGSTKTDNQGKWSMPATPTGRFYAKVTRRKEGTAGTIVVCRADTSPTRHFGT
jgi:hypothetical protein